MNPILDFFSHSIFLWKIFFANSYGHFFEQGCTRIECTILQRKTETYKRALIIIWCKTVANLHLKTSSKTLFSTCCKNFLLKRTALGVRIPK